MCLQEHLTDSSINKSLESLLMSQYCEKILYYTALLNIKYFKSKEQGLEYVK